MGGTGVNGLTGHNPPGTNLKSATRSLEKNYKSINKSKKKHIQRSLKNRAEDASLRHRERGLVVPKMWVRGQQKPKNIYIYIKKRKELNT